MNVLKSTRGTAREKAQQIMSKVLFFLIISLLHGIKPFFEIKNVHLLTFNPKKIYF